VLESDFRWNDESYGLSIFCETGKFKEEKLSFI